MNRIPGVTLFICCSYLVSTPAQAGTMMVANPSGGFFSVKVTSVKERRFSSTIKQQYDFSCGSAALATLLTYHYQSPVTEQEIFKEMYDAGDQQKIRSHGFSLLDIKRYLDTRGFNAGGYHVSLDKLAAIGVPAIALINIHGYKHFVVIKGVTGKEVLVGDPASGTRTVSRAEFEASWNGLLFLVRNKKEVAKNHFNMERDWQVREKAPLGAAMSNASLANVTFLP